jgi:outer membrane protein assembly factor BamA
VKLNRRVAIMCWSVAIFMAAASIPSHGSNTLSTSFADTVKFGNGSKQSLSADTAKRYLQIQKIIIVGNNLTRNSIILRELKLKRGDVVTETDLERIIKKDQQKLFNLHLFNTATIRPIPIDTNTIDLLVEVDERWYTFPIPRFQLSDRNFNEWWENYDHDWSRVNYGLKLYQYNIWGRNHTLWLTAQFGFQRIFQMRYRIPYIDARQKQGLIVDFDFIEGKNVPDSTVEHKLNYFKSRKILRTTQGVGFTYTYRNNFYVQHRLKYEYRFTNIADTLAKLNPNYLGESRNRQQFDAITYEFASDRRDVIAYPLRGHEFIVSVQQTGLALHKDINKTSASVKFAGFVDLKNNFYLSNLSFFYWSTPDKLPYFNYGSMGYDKIFVRGYEIYVIEGSQFFLNKTTFKKRIFSRNWQLSDGPIEQFTHFPLAIYLKTFTDVGYVSNYSAYEKRSVNDFLTNKFIYGAGFGLDFVTAYDTTIRFEYSFTPLDHGLFFHLKKEF